MEEGAAGVGRMEERERRMLGRTEKKGWWKKKRDGRLNKRGGEQKGNEE